MLRRSAARTDGMEQDIRREKSRKTTNIKDELYNYGKRTG